MSRGTIHTQTNTMANKIQLAYMVADGLFLLMGVFILAFSVIVGNIKDEVPSNGRQAARNLLYQGFPLKGWYPDSRLVGVGIFANGALSGHRQRRPHLRHLRRHPPRSRDVLPQVDQACELPGRGLRDIQHDPRPIPMDLDAQDEG